MRKPPKHIIATKVGGKDQYVWNAPFGPDNKRTVMLTDDIAKARRFFDEQEAKNLISRFRPKPGRGYIVETFEAVTA